MPKVFGLVTLGVVAALALAGAVMLTATHKQVFTYSGAGISFNYPSAYEDHTFASSSNVQALLKRTSPDADITLAMETGADSGALMTKVNILDDLESNIARTLPKQYSGYQKDQSVREVRAGYNSLVHDFHFTGSDGALVYARLVIIPRNHDAYYITLQSHSKNAVNDDSGIICNSLKLQ
jgi:hypothetical protein